MAISNQFFHLRFNISLLTIYIPYKTLSKLGMEGNFCQLIKNTYEKPTDNIVLNGKRLNILPLRLGAREGCLFSSIPALFITVLKGNKA